MKIKVISKNIIRPDQFELSSQYKGHNYIFDHDARDYDWLVVYDDLPSAKNERLPRNKERLACPSTNSILITYEPSSIKFYGQDYINQYAHVLTSHEPHLLSHKSRHDGPPIGIWFYGSVADALKIKEPPQKTGLISTFMSPKAMKHSLHVQRFKFLIHMKDHLPDLTCFGKGFQYVETKQEALDPFKYHIAVENHVGPHHWTEKLSDTFLGYALPFYVGCTNLETYFPKESYIQLDIRKPEEAIKIINKSIAENEYEKRLPAIIEARRRILEDYNFPNMIGKVIDKSVAKAAAGQQNTGANIIHSRHGLMHHNYLAFVRYAWGKNRARTYHTRKWKAYLT